MIRFDDLKQRSIEWHEMKWGKIGGTLSKGLFVKSDTLLIDIMSQRIEDFEPEDGFTSLAMGRGQDLEPFARRYLIEYSGIEFVESGWLQSEENELLGISPDGITDDNTIACEIKCLARKKHLEILLSNDIPNEHINQLIHYFTVNPKLEKLHFIAFRPEAPKHFIKILDRDSIINIGTVARPVMKSIDECVLTAMDEANKLLLDIKKREQELIF